MFVFLLCDTQKKNQTTINTYSQGGIGESFAFFKFFVGFFSSFFLLAFFELAVAFWYFNVGFFVEMPMLLKYAQLADKKNGKNKKQTQKTRFFCSMEKQEKLVETHCLIQLASKAISLNVRRAQRSSIGISFMLWSIGRLRNV